jgi:hypothetical protein
MAYDDEYYVHEARGGRGHACCLGIFTLITMGICLGMLSNVSYFFSNSGFCYYNYYPCGVFGGWCRYLVCPGGGWWATTRPVGQDELPPPLNVTAPNGDYVLTPPGDGELDYWSVLIAATMGPVSSLLVVIFACGAASARSGPAGCTGIVVLTAGIMKMACAICLACQFYTVYDEFTVFNYFNSPQWVTVHHGSLMDYLTNNYYMQNWAYVVVWAFVFLCISCSWEMIFGLSVLFCNDHQITGVHEWDSQHISYQRRPRKYRASDFEATPPVNTDSQANTMP